MIFWRNLKIKSNCFYCYKEMIYYQSLNKKYCSKICSQKGQVTKYEHRCLECGNKFIAHISSKRKFCSYQCFSNRIKNNKKPKKQPKLPIVKIFKLCKECSGKILSRNKTFCSKICMSKNYQKTLLGSNNPNFGNGEKIKLAYLRGAYDNVDRSNNYSYGYKIKYKNNTFKSSWEYNFAKYLDDRKILWFYENAKFKLSNNKNYTPDFYIPNKNKYYEIKGYWREKSKHKYDLFKKEYPNIKIVLIEKKFYERLRINFYQRESRESK